MAVETVKMTNIVKRFGGIYALNGANFSAAKGEVHALMGENGAGKSTLMKILAGAYEKDQGEIMIDGKEVKFTGPKDSIENGVSIIYQEFALAKHLSVAENILIDNLNSKKLIIDWKQLREKSSKMLSELGFGNIDVMKKVSELSVAYQQIVEICKALSRNSKILIFDEPTAVLTKSEVEKLFAIINNLRDKGVCIIYISHRLDEIFAISDRITVMKDGNEVQTVKTKAITQNELVKLMIGRDLKDFFPKRNATIGEVGFKVENMTNENVTDISFEVRKGEVLGVSGLVGSGRTEAMRAIIGADEKNTGTVYVDCNQVVVKSPIDAVKHGIGMLHEDRKQHAVLLDLSVKNNATINTLCNFKGFLGCINKAKELTAVENLVKDLAVKTASVEQQVVDLSGGNQQKVALMKWLLQNCKVMIFDEPTRGVDVGAKIEIYREINKLAEAGMSIVMVSSEMEEIIGMSDRVMVMRLGKVEGFLEKDEINELNLIRLSMGVNANE